MSLDDLRRSLAARGADDAVVWRDRTCSFAELERRWRETALRLRREVPDPGSVVLLEGDYSPATVALFLALAEARCIIVPVTEAVVRKDRLAAIAQAEHAIAVEGDGELRIRATGRRAEHEHYDELCRRGNPGLVVFTSGSSGEPKAAVHDLTPLIDGHRTGARAYRAVTFLLYDHIGGVNTMLRLLASGGCMVCVEDRDPESVLAAVERHRVELLPVSPTFLNLVLLSEAHERHDLSSLAVVSYGTEPMPASTLARLRVRFPDIRLVQLYGLSEVGILPSRSKPSDSSWIEIGGDGADVRVVDGLLEVRADTAMLGYLNAPSPFTDDGWLRTMDAVDVDGPYFRIRGRRSDLINVGGEKVFPAEVESVLLEMDEVDDASVHGEESPIVGHIVCARLSVSGDLSPADLRRRVRAFCAERLEPFKVPVKVELASEPQHSMRFKRVRRGTAAGHAR